MARTLQEYADGLDQRKDLIWPQAPPAKGAAAQPSIKPIEGLKAVVWNLYGTLLRITDGDLLLLHHTPLRMQIALEKTIAEFNMWNSMTRKPGAPWEYLLPKYRSFVEDLELAPAAAAGDFTQADGATAWWRVLDMLQQKEFSYDKDFYGDLNELSQKVCWFFQSSLQGVAANPNAVQALTIVSQAGLVQGLLADAQPHSLLQALRAFRAQDKVPALNSLFDPSCLILSYQFGVRKPSPTLFRASVQRFAEKGIRPDEILYVANRLQGDLAVARQFGMRTALFAGDKTSLKASVTEIRHPDLRPKRLLTDLKQIREVIAR